MTVVPYRSYCSQDNKLTVNSYQNQPKQITFNMRAVARFIENIGFLSTKALFPGLMVDNVHERGALSMPEQVNNAGEIGLLSCV